MLKTSGIEADDRDDEVDKNDADESEYLIRTNAKSNRRAVNYGNFAQTTPKTTHTNGENGQDFYQLYSSQLLNALNDKRSKFQLSTSVYLLLIVNAAERFAYYGLICNYILYLNKQPLYWESYNASFILFIFLGK